MQKKGSAGMSSVGNRFKKMRLKKGFDIDKLSYLTKIDTGILERVEINDLAALSLNDVMVLASTLDTSLDYLLNGENASQGEEQEDHGLSEYSFLLQIFDEDILAYMSKYPVTYWANLFRKMSKIDITPDGMCKLINAVETVQPNNSGIKNGNQ
jgi:transcriptional regulator with XRE-family HTH domain